jgi:hypothetical protein
MRVISLSIASALTLSALALQPACSSPEPPLYLASSSSGAGGAGGATTASSSSTGQGGTVSVGSGSGPDNCAVDILFVIDNSGSMQEHAPGTIAAFSTFVDEMITSVPMGTSLHVGVTRATGFFDPGNAGGWGGPACNGITDGNWNPPDVANNMVNGQQGRLYEYSTKRYFDTDTSADPGPLKTWFEGAITGAIDWIDPHSNTETVVAGAAYPFHPANASFNQGFLREQGVLLLFLLSDSPDLSPAAVPTTQFINIVHDAKKSCGDACVLVTGAIAGDCYGQMGNQNTRLYDFMNGFGAPPPSWVNLKSGSDPDYKGVLGKALANVINTTCEMITTPK